MHGRRGGNTRFARSPQLAARFAGLCHAKRGDFAHPARLLHDSARFARSCQTSPAPTLQNEFQPVRFPFALQFPCSLNCVSFSGGCRLHSEKDEDQDYRPKYGALGKNVHPKKHASRLMNPGTRIQDRPSAARCRRGAGKQPPHSKEKGRKLTRSLRPFSSLEPTTGFEPVTYALRERCSTS
jgi:hypothetical protein